MDAVGFTESCFNVYLAPCGSFCGAAPCWLPWPPAGWPEAVARGSGTDGGTSECAATCASVRFHIQLCTELVSNLQHCPQ
ncbi:hypothetical protein V5799_026152 [Amblyomma americanum]|uniref:Uncharacterized protein n=1 Tax=Amblyomma americanum TaxID=6943 RepID=A0AAQ4DJD4_AMBAM